MRTREVRRVALALLLVAGIWSWIGPVPAWCEEAFREPASQNGWLFREGRFEVGAMAGGGVSLQHEPRSGTVVALLPRVGYVVREMTIGLPGSVEIVAQPGYQILFQDRTAHVGSLSVLLKYNIRTRTDFTPYLELGGGGSYSSTRTGSLGSRFNFSLQAGGGLQYALSDRHALSFAWIYQHLSNAGMYHANPGLNAGLFLLGFSMFY
jgi:opacity protein-like surface antigen